MSDAPPDAPPPPPAPNFGMAVVAGIIGGLVYGLALYFTVAMKVGISSFVTNTFLVGVPMAAPALGLILWDPRGRQGGGRHMAFGAIVVTVMLIASFFVLHEGAICLVMASPIFYASGMAGALLMGFLLRAVSRRFFPVVLIALPLLSGPVENHIVYPAREETVTTVTEIAAPVATVWRNLTEVRHIQPTELGWTFTQDLLGVPKPIDARLDGHGVGAVRQAVWGRGIHFEERIIDWQQNHHLAWRFRFAPDSIPKSLEGHVTVDGDELKVERGDYTLKPLPNGHTQVTLRTTYWMRTPLNTYCAWWGRLFIGDFHKNVLTVIRSRSERA